MGMKIKGCPKCGGDVRVDRDEYGWFEQCIQCGHTRDLETVVAHPQPPQKRQPTKGENWRLGKVELEPIVPFSLPSEEIRKGRRARVGTTRTFPEVSKSGTMPTDE